MNKKVLDQIDHFKLVKIPRYIEGQIQKCALLHLDLRDMGQLRDRMEGQAYYDRLKNDILSEYAFEKLIGLTKFNWEKRQHKGYKRKQYSFDEVQLNLVTFSGESLPKISAKHLNNFVFIYVNPELRVYVSGVAKLTDVLNEISALMTDKTTIVEYTNFKNLEEFSSIEDLKPKLDNKNTTYNNT